MIVDSSALIAVLRNERDSSQFAVAISEAEVCKVSAATYFEAAVVIDASRSPIASRTFDEFIRRRQFLIEPVTATQAHIARQAYRDFGRGSGHPARLNFGDCFAYALAKETGEPILFKGDDFTHTDIESAL